MALPPDPVPMVDRKEPRSVERQREIDFDIATYGCSFEHNGERIDPAEMTIYSWSGAWLAARGVTTERISARAFPTSTTAAVRMNR